MLRSDFSPFLSVLMTCLIISGCGGGASRHGGVDWQTFDYRTSQQRGGQPTDYDSGYTPTYDTCVIDGIHTHSCE